MEIKIDDNVPLPSFTSGSRHPATDTADRLNINQSFIWPNPDNVSNSVLKNRIRGMVGRLSPKRFTSRVVTEKVDGVDKVVVRVWRIADAQAAG